MIAELVDTLPTRSATPPRSVRHWIAQAILKTTGWRPKGPPPAVDKCIIIAAPHTANMDGFWLVVNGWYWDLTFNWLAKHTIFTGLTGIVLDWLGAIPVDRRAPRGLVGQLVDAFQDRDTLLLGIPPEGTRRKRKYWKSGFYHIARQANVPVVLSYLDYEKKTAGFGPCFYLSGDVRADMDRIRSFYAGVSAKYPERVTVPRLRHEDPEG